jgi:hypothetical protein
MRLPRGFLSKQDDLSWHRCQVATDPGRAPNASKGIRLADHAGGLDLLDCRLNPSSAALLAVMRDGRETNLAP